MTKPLTDHGIATAVVPLPSCGEPGETLGDPYDDVDACRRTIAEVDGPVVLCGHSHGGVIITEAGDDDRVTQLLYVTSVMPDAGQSQADLIGSEPAPWLTPSDEGTDGVDPDMTRELFLQGCDEITTQQALSRLTQQSLTPFTQPPGQIAWQQKQATYLVCTADLATPAEVQRRRVRPGAVSSTLTPRITHSSRAPTHSRRPSPPRSAPPGRPQTDQPTSSPTHYIGVKIELPRRGQSISRAAVTALRGPAHYDQPWTCLHLTTRIPAASVAHLPRAGCKADAADPAQTRLRERAGRPCRRARLRTRPRQPRKAGRAIPATRYASEHKGGSRDWPGSVPGSV
jgi:hypothetical protein